MQTSNFRISGKNPKAVAISRGIPPWYTGKRCIDLAPSWELLKVKDPEEYERRYKDEVLSKLHPLHVLAALEEDSILLCWEKPGEFCHRRLVAEWLEKQFHIEVPELEPITNKRGVQPQLDL